MAVVIDGNKIAGGIREAIRAETAALKSSKGIVPGHAVVLVGNDPATEIYVRKKSKLVRK